MGEVLDVVEDDDDDDSEEDVVKGLGGIVDGENFGVSTGEEEGVGGGVIVKELSEVELLYLLEAFDME